MSHNRSTSTSTVIVYAARREQVSDVWVAGQHLLKDRVLTTMNPQAIIAKPKQWAAKIQAADEHSIADDS